MGRIADKALELLLHPLGKRVMWVFFAILFYQSGLTFTIWLIEPHNFHDSRMEWAQVLIFPLLVPAFFWVNKRLGCATGSCASGECEVPDLKKGGKKPNDDDDEFFTTRMPGC